MWLLGALICAANPTSFTVPVARAESLRVTVEGTGSPVVLLPGLFGAAFGFRNVLPLLCAEGYRAIVVEPLGVGASSRPARADYSLTAQAERIAAVFDSLRIRQAVVVAHAVGASLALRVAARRPDLVRGIVSLDGGPAETATTPGFRRAMEFAPWLKLVGGVGLIRRQIRRHLVAASGDPAWVNDGVVAAYTAAAAADLDATLRAYLAMAASHERESLRPRLATIRCPVRLLVGSVPHAGAVPAREIDLLRRTLPAFAVDSIRGAGHLVHEERPAAVVSAVATIGRQPASPGLPSIP